LAHILRETSITKFVHNYCGQGQMAKFVKSQPLKLPMQTLTLQNSNLNKKTDPIIATLGRV